MTTNKQTTMHHALKALTNALDEQKNFREDITARLTSYKGQIQKIIARMVQSETDNKRLKSENNSLRTQIDELTRENKAFIRNQQMMESAINMACLDFQENTQFITEATRNALPSVFPVSNVKKPQDQTSNVSVSKRQRPTTMTPDVKTAAVAKRLEDRPIDPKTIPTPKNAPTQTMHHGLPENATATPAHKHKPEPEPEPKKVSQPERPADISTDRKETSAAQSSSNVQKSSNVRLPESVKADLENIENMASDIENLLSVDFENGFPPLSMGVPEVRPEGRNPAAE